MRDRFHTPPAVATSHSAGCATMDTTTPSYDTLTQTFTRLYRLQHLQAIASWDQAANMPPRGNEARTAAMAEMGALLHRMRTDVASITPMEMVVADMVPDNPGVWLFHCHLGNHLLMGMQGRYEVKPAAVAAK